MQSRVSSICCNRAKNSSLLFTILKELDRDGWDAVGVGTSDSYNHIVIADGKDSVLNLLPPNHLVVCAGHSRKKWEAAKKLLAEKVEHPFDCMSEEAAEALLHECAQLGQGERGGEVPSSQVFYSHSSDPFLVSFQRLAVATGVGVLHPETHLILHPQFGPWIALRFALVLRVPGAEDAHSLEEYISSAREEHPELLRDARGFCLDSDESRRAVDVLQTSTSTCRSYDVSTFLKARKSFLVGKSFMYDEEQMAYHYDHL
jgi:hypothetical protein